MSDKQKAYHAKWQRENKNKVKAYNKAAYNKRKHPEKYGIWISVKDRLPPEYTAVFTYAGYIRVSFYSPDAPAWKDGTITHWMSLPEPPKKGE